MRAAMKAERRKRGEPLSRKLSLTLLGLAGLGVGVWLFRSKRRRSSKRP
jgi:LPXTG-motif cell wall-anchored protein